MVESMGIIIRHGGSFGVLALLLFPVFFFIFKSSFLSIPSSSQWIEVLFSTTCLAGLSAILSVFLGIIGALGLSATSHHKYSWGLELFCLLPALLPPLVSILSWLNVSEFFFHFPFSFSAVLITHVLMSVGLVSVFFSRLFCRQIGQLSTWAYLHSLSRWALLKKLLFFELKQDLILIFLVIFAFCFTSFSVPLLVGGVSGQTLEVFIAEKLKQPSTWSEALFLFAIETGFIFLFFSFLLYKQKNLRVLTRDISHKLYLLPYFPFIVFPLLPSLFIFLGLGGPWKNFLFTGGGEIIWEEFLGIKQLVFTAWIRTLFVGIGTGISVFLLFSVVVYFLRDLFLRKFLLAYTGSSAAFMGFAFLLLGSESPFEVWFKWCLGLSLLFLPTLYRLMGESVLMRLKNQIDLVDLMGASRNFSFFKIIWPQCIPTGLFLSGIAAFWACGDFAYSSIVAGDQVHLALLIQDVFSLYRFELATILNWLLILTGLICFYLFARVGFVLHQKSYLQTR